METLIFYTVYAYRLRKAPIFLKQRRLGRLDLEHLVKGYL